MTLRRTAAEIGVATTTAFRWRHRLLDALRLGDDTRLSGEVAVSEWRYPWYRRLTSDPPPPHEVCYLLARDSEGNVASSVVDTRVPGPEAIQEVIMPRLIPGARLLTRQGHLGPVARAGRRAGVEVQPRSRISDLPLKAIVDYRMRLVRWLVRFRGVGTHYLDNYLAWHRFLEAVDRLAPPRAELLLQNWSFP